LFLNEAACAREAISLRQKRRAKGAGRWSRPPQAGICQNVASIEATAAPRWLLLQLGA